MARWREEVQECQIAELLALTALRGGTATDDDRQLLHSMTCIARQLRPGADIGPVEDYDTLLTCWKQFDQDREQATPAQFIAALNRAAQEAETGQD